MQGQEHIFLTGFMGSGKSTMGRKLAGLLAFPFFDLDDHIEQREKQSIAAIFETKGENAFRQIESGSLEELIAAQKSPAVISLGGGTVCFHNNLEKIKASGLLVYLELPAITLQQRLEKGQRSRPLLSSLSGAALLQSIEQRLEERRPFYAEAHITVNGLSLTPRQLHSAILAFREKNSA